MITERRRSRVLDKCSTLDDGGDLVLRKFGNKTLGNYTWPGLIFLAPFFSFSSALHFNFGPA